MKYSRMANTAVVQKRRLVVPDDNRARTTGMAGPTRETIGALSPDALKARRESDSADPSGNRKGKTNHVRSASRDADADADDEDDDLGRVLASARSDGDEDADDDTVLAQVWAWARSAGV
ncbi:hypothetical protein B0H14DRAFT_3429300 [Mycena olivaceomarginata]|nr:hypothetical protein B0H14DRAFT_3429300 [Mycena olivaceomarginata]